MANFKGRQKCKKDGCRKAAARNQVFCSAACSPFAHLSNVQNSIELDRLRKYTAQEPGEVSPPSSREEMQKESKQKSSTQSIPLELKPTRFDAKATLAILKESVKLVDPDGMLSPLNKENSNPNDVWSDEEMIQLTEKNQNGGTEITKSENGPRSRTAEPPQLLEPSSILVHSSKTDQSMTFADESIQLLQGFMRSLRDDGATVGNISAACNCAKQITNLLRLKLDILKWNNGR